MSYQITGVRFFMRETAPARFASALGKQGQAKTGKRVTSPLCHVHIELKDDTGAEAFGCSADRLSVRWLDKRQGRTKGRKLRELVSLIEYAGKTYLDGGKFENPFEKWRSCHKRIMNEGRRRDQEDLTSTFASALLERASLQLWPLDAFGERQSVCCGSPQGFVRTTTRRAVLANSRRSRAVRQLARHRLWSP